jgi:four helix bundle protein
MWQKSLILVSDIYKVTADFPSTEMYGLINQMRRAAVSIPSNIAEGYGKKEYW